MKRSKSKRILALALSSMMLIASGCSGKGQPETETTDTKQKEESTSTISNEAITEISLPIVEKPVTFKYWVTLNNSEIMETWNDTLSMQELERRTGVHIEFIHPTAGQEAQSFNLMIASGDIPDMIQEREGTLYYPGGGDKAIADGVYRDLTDLVDQHAPNYKKWISTNDTIAKMTVTDSGKRWGMFHLTEDVEPAWTGYVVRKDWLDELGLAVPVTLDDWYTVLKAFKTELGVESPLLVYNTGVPAYNHIISAFDIGGSMYKVNDQVKFGPMHPEYKEYLTMMNKWYEEGLLDQDFMGRTDPGFQFAAPVNLVATGKAGMFVTIWGVSADAYIKSGDVTDDPDFYLQPVSAPKKTPAQQIHFNYPSYQVRMGTAITSNCKEPEIAMQWLDYQYSEEGSNIISFGIEGDTFVLKDGEPYYTDKVLDPQEEGLTPVLAYQKYSRWDGPGIMQYKRMWQVFENTGQSEPLKALQVWAQDDTSYVMPPVTLTEEEANDYSNIIPDIETYVNEMTVRFIMGVESLDNFDEFVNQIQSMDIDHAIELQQNALDRYNSRIK